MKRFNISLQDFEIIRQEGGYYLDKTPHIHKLTQQSSRYFLCTRPRRFGKSVMISVMKYLYLGRKDLFDGLWIQDHRDWDKQNPVMILDFSRFAKTVQSTPALVQQMMEQDCYVYYPDGTKKALGEFPSFNIEHIATAVFEETGRKLVILVDEYDKPVLEFLNSPDDADAMRLFFRGWYAPIKTMNHLIEFFRLSGLTKVMKMNIFSVLNNIDDISFAAEYNDLIGYTHAEVEANFKPEIQEFADANGRSYDETIIKMKDMYNGFCFGKISETLYSPRDINKALKSRELEMFRVQTGVPSSIREFVGTRPIDLIPIIEDVQNNELIIRTEDLLLQDSEHVTALPLFFQGGYFTIRGKQDRGYLIDFPNKQAEVIFLEFFAKLVTDTGSFDPRQKASDTIIKAILKGDGDSIGQALTVFLRDNLAHLPSERVNRNPEGRFKTILGIMLRTSLFYRWPEVPGLGVRPDMLIVDRTRDGHCRVVEAKVNESTKQALTQIEDKYVPQVSTQFPDISRIAINWEQGTNEVTVEMA